MARRLAKRSAAAFVASHSEPRPQCRRGCDLPRQPRDVQKRRMTDISYPAAMGAGLLSFLSPCVLPLAPPYLCYLAGTSLEALAVEGEADARRDIVDRRGAVRRRLFDGVRRVGRDRLGLRRAAQAMEPCPVDRRRRSASSRWALHFLGAFHIGAMMREKRVEIAKPPGLWSAYLMGLAFAFGWTPCIGPILAAILAVAGAEQTVASGAALLGAYALGLGAPFVLAAFAMGPFLRRRAALSQPVRAAGKGRRRAAGADRRRVSHRRPAVGFVLADRRLSRARAVGLTRAALGDRRKKEARRSRRASSISGDVARA